MRADEPVPPSPRRFWREEIRAAAEFWQTSLVTTTDPSSGALCLDASFSGDPRGTSSRGRVCLTLPLLLSLSAVFCPLSQTAS